MTIQFQVGKTYSTRSIGDHNCIYSIKVVSRTGKTIKALVGNVHPVKTLRVSVYRDAEQVKPNGTYANAAIIDATQTATLYPDWAKPPTVEEVTKAHGGDCECGTCGEARAAADVREAMHRCPKCKGTGSYIHADVENGPEFDSECPCDCEAGERLMEEGMKGMKRSDDDLCEHTWSPVYDHDEGDACGPGYAPVSGYVCEACGEARDGSTNVLAYFETKLGDGTCTDQSLAELDQESNCGRDCVAAIDAAALLIDHIRKALDTEGGQGIAQVIDTANLIVAVYWRG